MDALSNRGQLSSDMESYRREAMDANAIERLIAENRAAQQRMWDHHPAGAPEFGGMRGASYRGALQGQDTNRQIHSRAFDGLYNGPERSFVPPAPPSVPRTSRPVPMPQTSQAASFAYDGLPPLPNAGFFGGLGAQMGMHPMNPRQQFQPSLIDMLLR